MQHNTYNNLFTLNILAIIVGMSQGTRYWYTSGRGSRHPTDDDRCDEIMDRIVHGQVTSPVPPDVTGIWTSSQCETRPGPEYIVRKYMFHNNSYFDVHQYLYYDAYCTRPLYGIEARGTYHSVQGSWTLPGATEFEYYLNRVTVIPYDPKTAVKLQLRVNRTCPTKNHQIWRPYERYDVMTYSEETQGGKEIILDRDCTNALKFNLHELQVMRVEIRTQHGDQRRELYLGNVHTDRSLHMSFRPTSYQEPLVQASPDTSHGSISHRIAHADDYFPPELPRHNGQQTAVFLPGEWSSVRCETRPSGIFLIRRLLFENDGRTWQGHFHHFSDPSCRQPLFSLFAWGSYFAGAGSKIVEGAYDFDFKVIQLMITPLDEKMVDNLNSDVNGRCGQSGNWKLGVQHDVTDTNGCTTLSIKVPHIEYELVKMEQHHSRFLLYFGARPSDGTKPDHAHKRPTSFQPALTRCRDRIDNKPRLLRNNRHFEARPAYELSQSSGDRARFTLAMITLIMTPLFTLVIC